MRKVTLLISGLLQFQFSWHCGWGSKHRRILHFVTEYHQSKNVPCSLVLVHFDIVIRYRPTSEGGCYPCRACFSKQAYHQKHGILRDNGNLLRDIDNKVVSRRRFNLFTYVLFWVLNTLFIRKQNGTKLNFFNIRIFDFFPKIFS